MIVEMGLGAPENGRASVKGRNLISPHLSQSNLAPSLCRLPRLRISTKVADEKLNKKGLGERYIH